MPIDVNFKVDITEVRQMLSGLPEKTIRFVTALALTRTAQLAQRKIRESLSSKFILRRSGWEQSGVRIVGATKQNLTAVVKDIHRYMVLQETGGEKIPYKHYLAVPLPAARPGGPRSLIPPNLRPTAIMSSAPFTIQGKRQIKRNRNLTAGFEWRSPSGFLFIAAHMRGEHRMTLFYLLLTQAEVHARLGLAETVELTVLAHFNEEFRKAFNEQQSQWR